MVIVIMGVIGGMVSVFMKSPIDAYFASARRGIFKERYRVENIAPADNKVHVSITP